ncbi:hypothetical protein FF011L_23310 [Roseimaritima multifibrata]|uniref:Uncharacterized protein n=1 Tax=Roseimaritima multifibrata TaxID=1930274 RepID=A0A517MF97_9BACT|nr:hypothetical protein FF011L_23310 [Roseimaritima multifibrata]
MSLQESQRRRLRDLVSLQLAVSISDSKWQNVDDQPAATEDQPLQNARLRRSVESFGYPRFGKNSRANARAAQ